MIGGAQLSLAVGAFTLKLNAATNARGSAWGAGVTAIEVIINATWASTAIAKNFFHAGGQLRLRLAQPGVTAQDTNWQSIFTGMGTVTLLLASATQSGTGGILTSLGYNNLTGSLTSIFVAAGSGAYASNSMKLEAATITSGVQFDIILLDSHVATGAGPDSVVSGTGLAIDVLYIGGPGGTGVAPLPTFTVVTPF